MTKPDLRESPAFDIGRKGLSSTVLASVPSTPLSGYSRFILQSPLGTDISDLEISESESTAGLPQSSSSELVIPHISLGDSRASTENGKNIGRLTVMVVGEHCKAAIMIN